MKAKFHVYLRQHQTQWYTAQILTMPRYAAYGPHPSKLLEELSTVVAMDVHDRSLLFEPHYFENLRSRSVRLEVKAVQHHRLVTVPMRFTVAQWKAGDDDNDLFEVIVPRLDLRFHIHGEENVDPWIEESIRHRFHMAEVNKLLAHRYERSERIETLEVSYFGADRFKKLRGPRGGPSRSADERHPPHPLTEFGVELVAEAKSERLSRALHRGEQLNELENVLTSRRSPSVLLVGASGGGKTAIIHELAHRIHRGETPERLNGAEIWAIGASRFIAGAKFLGEWQERAERVVKSLVAARHILYLGSLLEVITSGSQQTGLNVAQFLLPWIQSGDLSVIVESTPEALARAEASHGIFVRALQRLPIEALSPRATADVLERHTRTLSKRHKVTWATGIISETLDVIGRFGDPSELPGAGLGLLERIARDDTAQATPIGPGAAVRAFAQLSGFPDTLVDPHQRLDVDGLRKFFGERVIGQPRATELLCNVVLLLKAGLNDPDKPLGSYLFMGPTGVGKTESALTLAEYLFGDRKRLIRFDMSEYGDPGSAMRLVSGDADGQGPLTKRVREQPFSLLLFDEIEKADGGVFDLLLQILGEGRSTDDSGHTVRYTHCIIILTSNLGAGRSPALGFSKPSPRQLDRRYLEAAENFFRPEMINRIDHLVPFQ
ncbi:MAG: AAA family ATPase, partial [Myxococcota bacterium]